MAQSRIREFSSSATKIVSDADGEVVGRTRIQKMAYLLELAGVGDGFKFSYKHYGPYSQMLAESVRIAVLFNAVTEEKHQTDWGGMYSVYRASPSDEVNAVRKQILDVTKRANAVQLELAATAAYLSFEGYEDAWAETSRRKPEKAQHIPGAMELYREISSLETPNGWPVVN
ncbi:MAG: hypothetical protein AAF393_00670 [Pseudomonadota bacterium]